MQLDLTHIALIVDCSESMAIRDCTNGRSRADYLRDSLCEVFNPAILQKVSRLTLLPFATACGSDYSIDTVEDFHNPFKENEPQGSTNTSTALRMVLDKFHSGRREGDRTPTLVLVLTDGVPSNTFSFETCIEMSLGTLESEDQLFFGILQVGSDAPLRRYLTEYGLRFEKKERQEEMIPGRIHVYNSEHVRHAGLTSTLRELIDKLCSAPTR